MLQTMPSPARRTAGEGPARLRGARLAGWLDLRHLPACQAAELAREWRRTCALLHLPAVDGRVKTWGAWRGPRRSEGVVHLVMPPAHRLSPAGLAAIRGLRDGARLILARGQSKSGTKTSPAGGYLVCRPADLALLAAHLRDIAEEHSEPALPLGRRCG